jgi:hypothetical protein
VPLRAPAPFPTPSAHSPDHGARLDPLCLLGHSESLPGMEFAARPCSLGRAQLQFRAARACFPVGCRCASSSFTLANHRCPIRVSTRPGSCSSSSPTLADSTVVAAACLVACSPGVVCCTPALVPTPGSRWRSHACSTSLRCTRSHPSGFVHARVCRRAV